MACRRPELRGEGALPSRLAVSTSMAAVAPSKETRSAVRGANGPTTRPALLVNDLVGNRSILDRHVSNHEKDQVTSGHQSTATLQDLEELSIRNEVLAGLSARPKRLSSKFFYDARGSELFEAICEQPEYYLTRTEIDIMRTHGPAIGRAVGERVRLVEFGSGSGVKTRLLLQNLKFPAAYIPVEISKTALAESVWKLGQEMPELSVIPLAGDFTQPLVLPNSQTPPRRTVVYFPGSTLGNSDQDEALQILRNIRVAVGMGGGALIGIDLKKDVSELEAAYNDRAGVTAAFTLNMLTHLNRVARTNFDTSAFKHEARYDTESGRIETNLVSITNQAVQLAGATFKFSRCEKMLVEYSHKYALDEVESLAKRSNMRVAHVWTDPRRRFAVVHMVSTVQ